MSLIDSLKNEINISDINGIGESLGLNTIQVGSALNTAIPAVLAGFLKNGNSSIDGLKDLFLSNSNVSAAALADSKISGVNSGKSLLSSVFGTDDMAIVQSMGDKLGLTGEKTSNLLESIIPFITGAITKLITSKGWSMPEFLQKIIDNKSEITAALPSELHSKLGLTNFDIPHLSDAHASVTPLETPVVAPPVIENIERRQPVTETRTNYPTETKKGSIAPWIIGILVVGAILWLLLGKGCNSEKAVVAMDSLENKVDTALATVKGKINEAGDYVFDTGNIITKKLPNGTELSIGSNSVENKLIDFIEDKNKAVDKTTWFTFDRLYFESAGSTLKAESKQQLDNIAAILKAFPKVELKLGGYTDNTGDAMVNKRLSEERADAAKSALVALGIDKDRLETEGYGDLHPIAGNGTAEGRAQNRRIDIRVTEK